MYDTIMIFGRWEVSFGVYQAIGMVIIGIEMGLIYLADRAYKKRQAK